VVAALQALSDGLHQPRRVKDYAKVLVRIGRDSASSSPVSPTTIRSSKRLMRPRGCPSRSTRSPAAHQ
jgi:hypothetical protein